MHRPTIQALVEAGVGEDDARRKVQGGEGLDRSPPRSLGTGHGGLPDPPGPASGVTRRRSPGRRCPARSWGWRDRRSPRRPRGRPTRGSSNSRRRAPPHAPPRTGSRRETFAKGQEQPRRAVQEICSGPLSGSGSPPVSGCADCSPAPTAQSSAGARAGFPAGR